MSVYTGPERRQQSIPVAQDRRKGGRPRLVPGEVSTNVNVKLPAGLHDHACLIALREGISVSAVIRDALERFLQRPDASA